MHIMKVLDPLEKLETKISELYEWFSGIYSYDAEAASFFFRISIDETAHANLVKYEKRLAVLNSKLFAEVSLDPVVVTDALETVTSVLSAAPPILEEAVKISLDIEKSAAEAHFRAAIAQAMPDISRLLKSLGGFDNRHIEVFEKFAASRGYPFVAASRPSPETQAAPGGLEYKAEETPITIPADELDRIEYYYDSLKFMDYYKLLGVHSFASSDQIKNAFRSLAREFHPDRYVNASADVQKKLNDIIVQMTNAYSTLMDPIKRKNYDVARPRLWK